MVASDGGRASSGNCPIYNPVATVDVVRVLRVNAREATLRPPIPQARRMGWTAGNIVGFQEDRRRDPK
jgi:hypothetical protein